MDPIAKKEKAKSFFVILDITLRYHTETKKFSGSLTEFLPISVLEFLNNL